MILKDKRSCLYSCLCLTAVIPDGRLLVVVPSVCKSVLVCALSAAVCVSLLSFPFVWSQQHLSAFTWSLFHMFACGLSYAELASTFTKVFFLCD